MDVYDIVPQYYIPLSPNSNPTPTGIEFQRLDLNCFRKVESNSSKKQKFP